MTEIVLVRHGETEFNAAGVFRGRADVALNERGLSQAEAVANTLSCTPVAAVFASPMVRAMDTARAVASRHDLEPLVDLAFNNIDLGEWQGREKECVRLEQPELWRLWKEDPDALEIPGGESLADVRERAYARTLELVDDYEGQRGLLRLRIQRRRLRDAPMERGLPPERENSGVLLESERIPESGDGHTRDRRMWRPSTRPRGELMLNPFALSQTILSEEAAGHRGVQQAVTVALAVLIVLTAALACFAGEGILNARQPDSRPLRRTAARSRSRTWGTCGRSRPPAARRRA